MRKASLAPFVLLLFAIAPAWLHAQERAVPVLGEQFWTSVAIKGRPPKFFNDIIGKETRKKFQIGTEFGYRSADSFLAGRQFYADAGISYDVTRALTIGVEQRYAHRPGNEDRTRTIVQASLGGDVKRSKLNYRLRYQHNYREFGEEREVIRNRFTVEHDFAKWKLDPFIGAEFFTWARPDGLMYIGTRYRLGTTWKLSKAHSIDLTILHDRERDIEWPAHNWIYSIDYSFNIAKVDRKKPVEPAP